MEPDGRRALIVSTLSADCGTVAKGHVAAELARVVKRTDASHAYGHLTYLALPLRVLTEGYAADFACSPPLQATV